MRYLRSIIAILSLLAAIDLSGHDRSVCFNDGWKISSYLNNGSKKPVAESIVLPHTWNASDVLETKDYQRTVMLYSKDFVLSEAEVSGKRLFIYFEGVNSVATVFANRKFVGEHLGGYTAFCYEITDKVAVGENRLEVLVSNAFRTDVTPVTGDFNVFGGIHRPVHLIVTGQDCISPLDYASPGVYVRQENVSKDVAELSVLTRLSLTGGRDNLKVSVDVAAHDGTIVGSSSEAVGCTVSESVQKISIKSPVLWNGRKNPYLYTVNVALYDGEELLDKVSVKTGFRFFEVDRDKGFFLNGEYLDLYGFGKHEDMKGKGSALSAGDYRNDFAIIEESGATSMRFTHYPHAEMAYDLCDSLGIVVWSEIANVGPGGFIGPGYFPTEAFHRHLEESLVEMIRQKFNHPSICFWGLFNELNFNYDDPRDCLLNLDALAKREDPSRLTACATFMIEDYFSRTADLVAYNKYFGWYEGVPEGIGSFLDEAHAINVATPVAVSEYGAGGSIYHHDNEARKPVHHENHWHPEEYQSVCHEKNWIEMSKRSFVWGKYIWNFADFSSSVKNEGDSFGINDKGIVTHDRSAKKDVFYFYKANWNKEPMLYLTSKRQTSQEKEVVDVKVYTNLPEATLYVNGRKVKTLKSDDYCRIVWHGIRLTDGENRIEVKTKYRGQEFSDSCIWNH